MWTGVPRGKANKKKEVEEEGDGSAKSSELPDVPSPKSTSSSTTSDQEEGNQEEAKEEEACEEDAEVEPETENKEEKGETETKEPELSAELSKEEKRKLKEERLKKFSKKPKTEPVKVEEQPPKRRRLKRVDPEQAVTTSADVQSAKRKEENDEGEANESEKAEPADQPNRAEGKEEKSKEKKISPGKKNKKEEKQTPVEKPEAKAKPKPANLQPVKRSASALDLEKKAKAKAKPRTAAKSKPAAAPAIATPPPQLPRTRSSFDLLNVSRPRFSGARVFFWPSFRFSPVRYTSPGVWAMKASNYILTKCFQKTKYLHKTIRPIARKQTNFYFTEDLLGPPPDFGSVVDELMRPTPSATSEARFLAFPSYINSADFFSSFSRVIFSYRLIGEMIGLFMVSVYDL